MKKEKIIIIIECFIVFILFFILNTFYYNTHDHIWDFMHSFSIANGLYIYKDFNIIVGPVYPIFMALILKLYGNNLLVFDIANSLLVVCIYLLIGIHNKKTLALYAIILCFIGLTAKYNVFTLLLFYIIYYLEKGKFKYKDYIIGILLSLLLFTKINIGCALILATIIVNIKDVKCLLKRVISLLLTSIIIVGLMAIFGVLSYFINYTILGLFDFTSNTTISYYAILVIISIIYILLNIKKDKYLVYMLLYLIMAIPLLDKTHVVLAIFPTILYALDNLKQTDRDRIIIKSLTIVLWLILCIYVPIKYHENILDLKQKCVNGNCFISNNYKLLFKYIHGINEEIVYDDDYRVFYISTDAYLYKYDIHENIDKYDLLLNGNMGYDGEQQYINEINDICSEVKCMFIIDKDRTKKNYQFPFRIRDFVIKKYNKNYEINYNNSIIYVYTNDY